MLTRDAQLPQYTAKYDWTSIRERFVTQSERPSYADLSAEFCVPENQVRNKSSDEGWVSLRAAHIDRQLLSCDAGSVVLAAIKADGAIVRGFTDLGFVALEKIRGIIDDPDLAEKAASTRSTVVNTCMFACANLAKALKDLGVCALPTGIREGAKLDNGRWNDGLLQQINVTVQNLQAQSGKPAEASSVAPTAAPDIEAPS